MKAAMEAHPYAMAAFGEGKAQQSLYWQDPTFGIWCRARLDFLPAGHNIIADYKTTRSAQPEHLQRAIWDYGYHCQAQWYLAGVETLELMESPRFRFVFQQKTPPYLVTCITPHDTALYWGEVQNRKARDLFARCLRDGEWPGYTDDIVTLDLPTWAHYRLQERTEQGQFQTAREFQAPIELGETA